MRKLLLLVSKNFHYNEQIRLVQLGILDKILQHIIAEPHKAGSADRFHTFFLGIRV